MLRHLQKSHHHLLNKRQGGGDVEIIDQFTSTIQTPYGQNPNAWAQFASKQCTIQESIAAALKKVPLKNGMVCL